MKIPSFLCESSLPIFTNSCAPYLYPIQFILGDTSDVKIENVSQSQKIISQSEKSSVKNYDIEDVLIETKSEHLPNNVQLLKRKQRCRNLFSKFPRHSK